MIRKVSIKWGVSVSVYVYIYVNLFNKIEM